MIGAPIHVPSPGISYRSHGSHPYTSARATALRFRAQSVFRGFRHSVFRAPSQEYKYPRAAPRDLKLSLRSALALASLIFD